MKNYNPITLIQNLRKVYSKYSSSLDVKVKWWILAIICMIILDSSLGISRQLLVNTKIDTIEHILSTKPIIPDSDLVKHKEAIVREYINHQTIWEKIGSLYIAKQSEEPYTQWIRLIAPILFPLFLVLIWIRGFVKTIFTSTPKQNEHIVNMLYVLLFLCLYVYLLQSLSTYMFEYDYSTIKMILLYVGLNIIPYIAFCWIVKRLLKIENTE